MNISLDEKGKRNSRGQVLVEFALLFPIVALAFFALIELNNVVVRQQMTANLSREAASAAYRDCAILSGGIMDDCLQKVYSETKTAALKIFPNFNSEGAIIISLYENDPVTQNPKLKRYWPASGNLYGSKYSATSVDKKIVSEQKVIAVGEVFYQYTPITPVQGFLNLFNDNPVIPDVTYETTIY